MHEASEYNGDDGQNGQGGGGGASSSNSGAPPTQHSGRGGDGIIIIAYVTEIGQEVDQPTLARDSLDYSGTAQNIMGYLVPSSANIVVADGSDAASQTDVGQYTLKVQPAAGYRWTGTVEGSAESRAVKTFPWSIVPKPLNGNATIASIPNQTYTGQAITPTVQVTDTARAVLLTLDADYTVTYKENVNVGAASVEVKGKGNYSGQLNASFTILAPQLSAYFAAPTMSGTGAGDKWENAMAIGDAISAANSSSEDCSVYLKAGIYEFSGSGTAELAVNATHNINIWGGYIGASGTALTRPTGSDPFSVLDGAGSATLFGFSVVSGKQVVLQNLVLANAAKPLTKSGDGSLLAEHCLFKVNSGKSEITAGPARFELCTFAKNPNGSLAVSSGASATVKNSILWNSSSTTEITGDGTVTLDHTLLSDSKSGTGVIHSDPQFVSDSDFHLKSEGGHFTYSGFVVDAATSPAVDAGDGDYSQEPLNSAGKNNGLDLGVYGNTAQATKSVPPIALQSVTLSSSGTTFVRNGTYAPTYTVSDANGATVDSTYYTATWSPANPDIQKTAGTYTLTITADGTAYSGTVYADYVIEKRTITVPENRQSAATSAPQTCQLTSDESIYCDMSNGTQQELGDYTVTLTFKSDCQGSCKWSDDTTDSKSFTWSIVQTYSYTLYDSGNEWVQVANVPNNYTDSDGTRVDLGFALKLNDTVVTKVLKPLRTKNGSHLTIWGDAAVGGVAKTSSETRFGLRWTSDAQTGGLYFHLNQGDGTAYQWAWGNVSDSVVYTMNWNGLYTDGVSRNPLNSGYPNPGSTATTNVFLFANREGSQFGNWRYTYFQVTNSTGTLTHNFVPAVREPDKVVGFYDKVTGDFRTTVGYPTKQLEIGKTVQVPTANTPQEETGGTLNCGISETADYSVTGEYEASAPGNHVVTLVPKDSDITCLWSDGTTGEKQITWTILAKKTWYLVTSDGNDYDTKNFSYSHDTRRWCRNPDATNGVSHAPTAGYDYVVLTNRNIRMYGEQYNAFLGDSLTLYGNWALRNKAVKTVNLIGMNGGVIQTWNTDGYTPIAGTLAIPDGQSLRFALNGSNDGRKIEIKSTITGSGTIYVYGSGASSTGLKLSGNGSAFTGKIAQYETTYPTGFELVISGSFGGTIESLPPEANVTQVRFNCGENADGLVVSSTTIPEALKTKFVVYGYTDNTKPLITFPAGTSVDASQFTIYKTADATSASKTAFGTLEARTDATTGTVSIYPGKTSIADAVVTYDSNSKIYNGAVNAPTVTVTLNGETLSAATDYEIVWTPAEVKNVGEYTPTITAKSTSAYSGEVTSKPTYTITKASLTVKAEDKEIAYGAAAPTYTASATGLQGSDTLAGQVSGLQFSCDYTTGSNWGSYTITVSDGMSVNYDLSYSTGILTVTKPETLDLAVFHGAGPEVKNVPTTWLDAAYGSKESKAAYQQSFLSTNEVTHMPGWSSYLLGFTGDQVANNQAATVLVMEQNADASTHVLTYANFPTENTNTNGISDLRICYTAQYREGTTGSNWQNLLESDDPSAQVQTNNYPRFALPVPTNGAPVRTYRLIQHFLIGKTGGGGGDEKVIYTFAGPIDGTGMPTEDWTLGKSYDDLCYTLKLLGTEDYDYVSITYSVTSKYDVCKFYTEFCKGDGGDLTMSGINPYVASGFNATNAQTITSVLRVPVDPDCETMRLIWVDSNVARQHSLTHLNTDMQVSGVEVKLLDYNKAAAVADDIFTEHVNQEAWTAALSGKLNSTSPAWVRNLGALKAALTSGNEYKILMMGDSTSCAAQDGCVEALIKRKWPNSNIKFYLMWAENAGCYHFAGHDTSDDGLKKRNKALNFDYSPYDLIVFSGITQTRYSPSEAMAIGSADQQAVVCCNVTNSVREVMDMIRSDALGARKNTHCDFVMMSSTLSVDSRSFYIGGPGFLNVDSYATDKVIFWNQVGRPIAAINDWTVDNDQWAWRDYRPIMTGMPIFCENAGIAHWDFFPAANDYLYRSGKYYQYYSRDAVHPNEYGYQVTARLVFEAFKIVAEADFSTP